MTLLVLDTSTRRAALALVTAGGLVRAARPDPEARHGRALLPAVRDLLAAAGLRAADLDGLAVGVGPGSYTGLRVGVTAAKTLAYALGKPLAALDSLEAVARNAPDDALTVAAIADAQRGDLYAADFARRAPGGPLVRTGPTRVVAAGPWAAGLAEGAYVLGPAMTLPKLAAAVLDHARSPGPDRPDDHDPDPERLAALALEVWRSGRRDDPLTLEPVYLRRSAAEDQWERRVQGAEP